MTDLPLLPRISDYPAYHAGRTPTAPAASLNGRVWSYADLAASVDRLGRGLMAAGIAPGDRVAMLSPPNPDFLAVFLATASIGAIWVGLNPKYQRGELAYVVGDSEPKLVIGRRRVEGRDYVEDLAALAEAAGGAELILIEPDDDHPSLAELGSWGETVGDAAFAARKAAVKPRDPCLIVYTSGSTGRPKGAVLHHEGLVIPAHDERERLTDDTPMSVLNYMPINHIACVGDISALTLVLGGKLAFLEKFDVQTQLRMMASEELSSWGTVPSVFELSLAHPDFATTDFSTVKGIFWGGAAMPAPTIRALMKISDQFGTNYGLTESCGPITATGIVTVKTDADIADLIASVGAPTTPYQVRLRAADGTLVETPDVDGEIEAFGRPLFLGYWRRPEATAEAFTEDGWFRTGDVGAWLTDGRIRITGRIKEMYKSGGYNVYPREIETALETHPAVSEAAVVGIPDPVWGEVGVAYVIARDGADPGELITHCKAMLANYKVPKRVVVESDLPRLPVGKVDKVALRKRALETGGAA